VALIKDAAGDDLHEAGEYKARPVELPTDILNDFLEERFVTGDGNDPNGGAIYRINQDGKIVAKNAGGVL
jgi:hypothetical protein